MRTPSPQHVARSLGLLAVATLASCSMPSQEAWRQIQKEGLIPYVINSRHEGADAVAPQQQVADHSAPTQPSAVAQASSKPVATPSSSPSVPPPSQLNSESLITAQPVPGLAGYVRSPFTNPPRLVDVRGMSAGSKVVCPYTRKPFIVPVGAQEPAQQVASNPAPAPQQSPAPAPLPKPQPQVAAMPTPPALTPKVTPQAPTTPTKVAVNSTPAPQPPPQPQVKPNPPVQKMNPPTAEAKAELPFGVAIPGRPGFVNSPYAAKHQLVDVTGLPTGMEVKCPYTGKLFRVPPQAEGSAPAKQ